MAYLLARSSASFFPGELEAEHPRSAMVAVMGRSQGCVPLRNQAVHNIANMCFSVYTYLGLPFGHFLGLWAFFLLVSDFERKN